MRVIDTRVTHQKQHALAMGGRAPADAKDDVATGLQGNLITQRLKLNSRVALVTGAACPRLSWGRPLSGQVGTGVVTPGQIFCMHRWAV